MYQVVALACLLATCDPTETVPSDSRQVAESQSTNVPNPPSLAAVELEVKGWKEIQRADNRIVWGNADGDVMSLLLFPGQSDIPAFAAGLKPLRSYFRKKADSANGGIVEVEHDKIDGIECVRAITKIRHPKKPSFIYMGMLAIPRDGFKFVIVFRGEEHGTTGLRDAMAFVKELPNPKFEDIPADPGEELPEGVKKKRAIGWSKDPYDTSFDDKALYNLSDQVKYDKVFPNHPLSRVRRNMSHFIETTKLAKEIHAAAAYSGPKVEP